MHHYIKRNHFFYIFFIFLNYLLYLGGLGIVKIFLITVPNFLLILRLKCRKMNVFGYHRININLIPKNFIFLGITIRIFRIYPNDMSCLIKDSFPFLISSLHKR